MARDEAGGLHSTDEENAVCTETTPLLLKPDSEIGAPAANDCPNGLDNEQTIIVKELSLTKLALIMGTAWFGVFLGALDSTVIATLSAPISSEFHSMSLLPWLATAYLISNAACQPISGRLTDIFGRGPGLVFCNLFFAAGNLICGLATSQYVLIFGRVIAGIGGGGLMSIPTFLGSDLIPLRKRGLVGGIACIWLGSGSMVGGVFGGLLNDYTTLGWRLAFLVQVPPKQSDRSYLARIDFLGVILTSSFLMLLVLGLNSGGNLVPWWHPLPVSAISISLALFIAFIWWESRALQPVIPVKLLLDRTVLAACLTSLLVAMLAMTCIFYVPLYLQVLGESATGAGLKTLSSPIGISIGALVAGYIMKRTGKFVGLGIASVMLLMLGTLLFSFQTKNTPTALTTVAFFFVGGGYSAVLATTQIACLAAVDHSQQAVVTSSTYLARSLGGTVGITVASAVYHNTLNARLWERFGDEPGAADRISRIRDDIGELRNLPEGWYDGVVDSFIEAFRGVWLTMLGWAVLALACVSPMKQHKLHSTLDRRGG
ncbi:major facilitator superfamily protein [Hirsutella rhossiliensis]|uniref:Major facilitator superfamily domain-containing protein n=1 Tax=Hirsutella rhossiliensis TaxID=111463 RepID=A0A9P8N5T6_9HYPO|nr:major facilitator superfamily domain-containing protein [Hirsutella rhossiliensis]KAH0967502.1 major facilitator superfamily domain-containing protein [Hirsutella rhossiliensis]